MGNTWNCFTPLDSNGRFSRELNEKRGIHNNNIEVAHSLEEPV